MWGGSFAGYTCQKGGSCRVWDVAGRFEAWGIGVGKELLMIVELNLVRKESCLTAVEAGHCVSSSGVHE